MPAAAEIGTRASPTMMKLIIFSFPEKLEEHA
jgi:hypothetical protein